MLSVSGAFISVVNDWLQEQGYGQSSLSQRIWRLKPNESVDIASAEAILAEAAAISSQELASLDIGHLVKRHHLGAIGHMLSSSTTLEQMLISHVFYESLFYGKNVANVRRNKLGMELYWSFKVVPENYARFAMSSFASAVEQMGLERNAILSVSFPFKCKHDQSSYLDTLGCHKVNFGSNLGIQFAKSSLQRSLRFDDQEPDSESISAQLFPEIEDQVFAEQLYHEIASALPKRQAKLSQIAQQMAVSERTLQRRLETCEDGLRGVINRTRMHLACEYLHDNSLNLLAVSLLLGYSEQSALQLAFKKHFGVSPGQWRKANCTDKLFSYPK